MAEHLTGPVAQEIAQRLRAALAPERLEVIDDSENHRGHFTVEIVAERFVGMNRVARQRAVNAALADLLKDRVHALAIKARAPGEA
jgi:BolA protein